MLEREAWTLCVSGSGGSGVQASEIQSQKSWQFCCQRPALLKEPFTASPQSQNLRSVQKHAPPACGMPLLALYVYVPEQHQHDQDQ